MGLNAVICIGETLEERNAGKTNEVLIKQLNTYVHSVDDWNKIVFVKTMGSCLEMRRS